MNNRGFIHEIPLFLVFMQNESKNFIQSLIPGLIFLLIIWSVKIAEWLLHIDLGHLGLYPLKISGLIGIITAPFIHGDFMHLISNSIPILILSTLVFYGFPKSAIPLTFWLFLASGFWTWCFAREAYHIGARGLVYGYAFFLFFSGIFKKDRNSLAISLLMIFLYSSLIVGLFPQEGHISWEAHLSGAMGGAVFAFLFRHWDKQTETKEIHHDTHVSKEENFPVKIMSIYFRPDQNSEKIKIL